MNITFTAHYVGLIFFGREEPRYFHSFDCRFKFGSYEQAQVSSTTTIRLRKSSPGPTKPVRLHSGVIAASRKFHGVFNSLQVCGNPECRAECWAQFCDIPRLPLVTHSQSIGDQNPTGKQGVQLCCFVLHVRLSCTEVVLNGIPVFPERFNPSCHCVIWQRCIVTCFTQSLKTFLCTKLQFWSRNVAIV